MQPAVLLALLTAWMILGQACSQTSSLTKRSSSNSAQPAPEEGPTSTGDNLEEADANELAARKKLAECFGVAEKEIQVDRDVSSFSLTDTNCPTSSGASAKAGIQDNKEPVEL